MARDVEFNYTANDKTGTAATSAANRMRKTSDSITKDGDRAAKGFEKSILQVADGISPKLAKNLEGVFSAASEAAGPALAAGAIAAAPLIGATLSAAIIGGAGLGGVIGGVLLAAHDQRVAAAGQALGDKLLSGLEQDASPFIQPVLDSISKISATFDVERGKIQNIFQNSSKFLGPLTDGVTRAIDGILDGFDSLISHAGPVMDQLGDSIGSIGEHIGTFLDVVGGGSDGAALALKNMTDAINGILTVAGPLVRGLTEIYKWVDRLKIINAVINPFLFVAQVGKQLADQYGITNAVMSKFSGIGVNVAAAAVQMANGIIQVNNAVLTTGPPLESFTDKVDRLAQSGRNLYDATTNIGEAIAHLNDSLKDNGKTLDVNTEKGRNNRNALSQLAGTLVSAYDAYVQVNGEGKAANKVADENRNQFIKLAGQFGLTKSAAGQLATQLGLIPAKKNTDFTANTHDAQARIQALQDQVNNVHGKTVSVNVVVAQSQLNKVNNTLNRLNGGNFDARNSFAFAGEGGGVSRTGGARPVEVISNVESSLYLDGSLIYGTTARQIRASSKRDAWRQKVGRR